MFGSIIPAWFASCDCAAQDRRSQRLRRRWLRLSFGALLVWLGGSGGFAAAAVPVATVPAATKVVQYHGDRLVVPASWPVYRLSADRSVCVRFDRHAVYLGQPSAGQRCPAHAAGRTEAILVQPLVSRTSAADGSDGQVLPLPSTAGAVAGRGSAAQLVSAARGVVVTTTWNHDPALVERAVGVRSLLALAAASTQRRPPPAVAATAAAVRADAATSAPSAPARPGSVYTGLGFDACATPSAAQMSAWRSSPYHAVGVYVGGANLACSQFNLTSSWVRQQSAAGWRLVPIYVGLQAPSNSCGCQSIAPGRAARQGAAAAQDAVAQSQAIGLGLGNPLYFDMEAYARGGDSSSAALAFLQAWTRKLHADGYESAVYSSSGSGIADLVSRFGTGYQEPDDIWIADWNGARRTSDPSVPSGDWSSHQRLHQYDGGHNATYRGATLSIDDDYLDGATAAAGSFAPAVDSSPAVSVSPAAGGAIDLYPSWTGAPGVSSWQVIAGMTTNSLTPIGDPVRASARMPIVIDSAYPYFAVRALGSAGQTLGSTPPVATPAHVAIFGPRAFVPRRGAGAVPVGCFRPTPCELTTRISAGGAVLASTRSERIAVGGGLAYFNLSPLARAMLARAAGHRLAVEITVRDATGHSATRGLRLIRYATSGPSPQYSAQQSPTLRIIGTTDFVANGWVGGILAGCSVGTPCLASATIAAAGNVIAQAGPQFVGGGELGYLSFSLTVAGHRILMQTRTNQLPAEVRISTGSTTATAQITLASYG